MALGALQKGNVDMDFLQDTKLTQGTHTQNGVGYTVWTIEVESRHWGGLAVVWRVAKGWQVDIMSRY